MTGLPVTTAVVTCVVVFCMFATVVVLGLGAMGVFDFRRGRSVGTHEHEEGDYAAPVGHDREEPLPVDPANPPRMTTYRLKDPKRPRRKCTCHDREIADDQQILLWPLPGGQYYALCREGAPEAFANSQEA